MALFRRRLFPVVATALILVIAVVAMQQQEPPTYTFRVQLGLKDQKPADWNGTVQVTGGEVTNLEGWRFETPDKIDGTSGWKCSTRNYLAPGKRNPVQLSTGEPRYAAELEPWANGVTITIKGNDPNVVLKLPRGEVKFSARAVELGQPLAALDGQVKIERMPQTSVVRPAAKPAAADPVQDDYPAFWVHYKTGKQYLAWVAYTKGRDRVLLAERDGPDGAWSKPKIVSPPGYHFRASLATTHDGKLWIVFARMVDQNWDLFARPYQDGKLGETTRLTSDPGPDFGQRMTTDSKGRAWLVWQGFRDGQSDIFARCVDGDGWHKEVKVSDSASNDWDPCVTADPKTDRVWVGWDSYNRTNYAARVVSLEGGPEPARGDILKPEESPLFQAHVSLACDRDGRLWAAWDESGPQWGKDTGFLFGGQFREDTSRLYSSRAIRVKVLVDGKWLEPKADFESCLPKDMKEYNEYPQLQADGEGRMWLAFRHRTCLKPREDGWAVQGRWDFHTTAYLGDSWLSAVELPESGGRNDMRADSQRDKAGNVYFAYASDNRGWFPPVMGPKNHHVAVSKVDGAAKPVAMQFESRKRDFPIVADCHPLEYEQVKRIRAYECKIGDKKYHIYRGDLHRHTDLSGDGRGDGSIADLHRYALDAALFDFIMVGDHNMGQDNEYCWWQTQQANDLYTVPGAFISVYGYERSVPYPNGHRNIIWATRGHKSLPLPKPLAGALKNDTARLYDYLRQTAGICTLHTSATSQGTDWADAHDPELEPFVEIFQGYHTSYEAPGAPKTIDDKTDRIHGKYESAGFVSKALDKGYKLGFQASSDHISTHVSYACIIAEEFSREGLVKAMKQRHTYAATDNIIMDVRMNNQLMGEEVRTAEPKLEVIVLGTNAIDKVEVIRNNKVVHTVEPKQDTLDEARFTWTDPAPLRGQKVVYYYVRVRQRDGQMAWASPIWVKEP